MSKKKEEALNALVQPIRDWLKGNEKRNALVILSEPRAKVQLVLVTNTTGNDMIPDMGMIVGMEPQLTDVHYDAQKVRDIKSNHIFRTV